MFGDRVPTSRPFFRLILSSLMSRKKGREGRQQLTLSLSEQSKHHRNRLSSIDEKRLCTVAAVAREDTTMNVQDGSISPSPLIDIALGVDGGDVAGTDGGDVAGTDGGDVAGTDGSDASSSSSTAMHLRGGGDDDGSDGSALSACATALSDGGSGGISEGLDVAQHPVGGVDLLDVTRYTGSRGRRKGPLGRIRRWTRHQRGTRRWTWGTRYQRWTRHRR